MSTKFLPFAWHHCICETLLLHVNRSPHGYLNHVPYVVSGGHVSLVRAQNSECGAADGLNARSEIPRSAMGHPVHWQEGQAGREVRLEGPALE